MAATVQASYAANGGTPGIFLGGPTGAPTTGDPLPVIRSFIFQAVNAATADQSIALPLGVTVRSIRVIQNVAPTGATSTMAVGTTAGGVDIATATDVKTTVGTTLNPALNSYQQLLVANFASVVASSAGGSVIWFRNAQGTPTAVGTFTVTVEYVVPQGN